MRDDWRQQPECADDGDRPSLTAADLYGEAFQQFDALEKAVAEREMAAAWKRDSTGPRLWWTCVALPRTSRDHYVTGRWALNTTDPDETLSGDWHRGGWHVPPPSAIPSPSGRRPRCYGVVSLSPLPGIPASTVPILGCDRIHDARPVVGHPARRRSTPVWCAHHERAIADIAWKHMRLGAGYPLDATPKMVDSWLWSDKQHATLESMLDRLTPHVPADKRHQWDTWVAEVKSI